MEPHPFYLPTITTLPTLPISNTDIIVETTNTVHYSIAQIPYTIDVTSSIPYRNAIVNDESGPSKRTSTFSSDTRLSQSNLSRNDVEFYDDNLWNKWHETMKIEMYKSETNVTTQQLPLLTSNLQENVISQKSSLSSNPQANFMTQPSTLQENIVSTKSQLFSNPQVKVAPKPLPLPSTLQTNITTQQLSLISTLQANIESHKLLLSSNPQTSVAVLQLPAPSKSQANIAIQSLPLSSTKFLQTTNEFQQNLLIRKIRLLNDQATYHAKLAYKAWEEARTIAASLNMPPPSLPDAIDCMKDNYLKYQKQWNFMENANEQENIKPSSTKIVEVQNSTSSSLSSSIQSTSKRTKPLPITNSSLNLYELLPKISRMEKNISRSANVNLTTNTTTGMVRNYIDPFSNYLILVELIKEANLNY